ncbi:MAG: hypothetical protein IPI67_36965 [Myxococcales bacterium]|nr:hypothetical protein [Myxococcales bacterium]
MSSRARLFLLCCSVPTLALGANTPSNPQSPPSSFESPDETARVVFEHTERRARRCDDDHSENCFGAYLRRPMVNALLLEAIPIPELRLGQKDVRQPKRASIPAGRTPGRAALRLAPGTWDLRVHHGRIRRIGLRSGDTLKLEVWTLIGRCVRGERMCLFQPDVLWRWIQRP